MAGVMPLLEPLTSLGLLVLTAAGADRDLARRENPRPRRYLVFGDSVLRGVEMVARQGLVMAAEEVGERAHAAS